MKVEAFSDDDLAGEYGSSEAEDDESAAKDDVERSIARETLWQEGEEAEAVAWSLDPQAENSEDEDERANVLASIGDIGQPGSYTPPEPPTEDDDYDDDHPLRILREEQTFRCTHCDEERASDSARLCSVCWKGVCRGCPNPCYINMDPQTFWKLLGHIDDFDNVAECWMFELDHCTSEHPMHIEQIMFGCDRLRKDFNEFRSRINRLLFFGTWTRFEDHDINDRFTALCGDYNSLRDAINKILAKRMRVE